MNRTAEIFKSFTRNDEWLGFGYLGERENVLEAIATGESRLIDVDVASVDGAVLEAAAGAMWTDEELFAWANSKKGRWFADVMFGGSGPFNERLGRAAQYLVLPINL